MAPASLEHDLRSTPGRQGDGGATRQLYFFAVNRQEKGFDVRSHQVDYFLLQGLRLIHGYRLSDSALRPFDVAPGAGGHRPRESGYVVHRLFAHIPLNLLSTARNRRGSADVRARRHRGDVGRHRDERPCGRGPRPSRSDVYGHGHARAENRFHDIPRTGDQTTRGIKTDDEELRLPSGGFFDTECDVFRSARRDGVGNVQHHDGGRLWRGGGMVEGQHRAHRHQKEQKCQMDFSVTFPPHAIPQKRQDQLLHLNTKENILFPATNGFLKHPCQAIPHPQYPRPYPLAPCR